MENTVTTHGYGVAAHGMVTSLQRLGHSVPFQDPTAPVEINFSQPYLWNWSSPNSYKIGYVAWESTIVPESWLPGLQTANEIWTPSPLIAQWFRDEGLQRVKVYQHGVDSNVWSRKRRRPTGPIRFLHIGEPAPRKGGQMTYDVFRDLFGGSSEATLTFKGHGSNRIRGKNNAHIYKETPNVRVITEEYEEWQMVDLVKRHDVLVYPSWGEGFGLIPLQAMVTGMPVICTEAWAPYKDHLLNDLRLDSKLADSPWPDVHTGKMYKPDKEDLAAKMTYAVNNYTQLSARAFRASFTAEDAYSWDRLTKDAFNHIEKKFS